tara:strand:+ start:981 stop:1187 length:207 start_codon:yes stop_codon:yes gene_type:complete
MKQRPETDLALAEASVKARELADALEMMRRDGVGELMEISEVETFTLAMLKFGSHLENILTRRKHENM